MNSTLRLYIYSRDGQEFTRHPLNAKPWCFSGPVVCKDGRTADRTGDAEPWRDSKGRPARLVASVQIGPREVDITADAFHASAVLCKLWTPGAKPEWFWLIDDSAAAAIAKKYANA